MYISFIFLPISLNTQCLFLGLFQFLISKHLMFQVSFSLSKLTSIPWWSHPARVFKCPFTMMSEYTSAVRMSLLSSRDTYPTLPSLSTWMSNRHINHNQYPNVDPTGPALHNLTPIRKYKVHPSTTQSHCLACPRVLFCVLHTSSASKSCSLHIQSMPRTWPHLTEAPFSPYPKIPSSFETEAREFLWKAQWDNVTPMNILSLAQSENQRPYNNL